MYMDTIQLERTPKKVKQTDPLGEQIREKVLEFTKDFKTSWLNLGQVLYTVWEDKLYHAWGYEKFEQYVEKEVGLKKQIALKLLKSYLFLEENEPSYLNKEFKDKRDSNRIPGVEEINFLRLARGKKELLSEDYRNLKKAVFDKGRDVASVRKDLTAMMKERKQVDPDEERQERHEMAVKRIIHSLKNFSKDMQVLKLIRDDLMTETSGLIGKLESELD